MMISTFLRLYDAYPVVEMKYGKREEGYGALGAYIVRHCFACASGEPLGSLSDVLFIVSTGR